MSKLPAGTDGPMTPMARCQMSAARQRTGRADTQRRPEGHAGPPGVDRIVLAGFMGSGKTTVGTRLAERLGWRFLDLDREIERRDGRSVPAIFAESGEAHFRQLESAALAELLADPQTVLALGGGAPEIAANRLLLEQAPRTAVVYLHAPLATLLERCRQDAAQPERVGRPLPVQRPLLVEAESRFQVRHPIYERLAGHRIETETLDIEQTAAAILKALAGGINL